MKQNKDKYLSSSSTHEYNLASQYALCIKENATLRGTDVSYSEERDKYMAEKVRWILDYEKENGNNSLFIAEHNRHIEKTSANQADYTSIGQRLNDIFKDENLNKILSSKQKMGNVGAEFNGSTKFLSATYTIKMVPDAAYDAVILVRNATPSTMLK